MKAVPKRDDKNNAPKNNRRPMLKKYLWLIVVSVFVGTGLGGLLERRASGFGRHNLPLDGIESQTPYPISLPRYKATSSSRRRMGLGFLAEEYPLLAEQNSLSMDARLSKDGQLEVWLSSPPKQNDNCNRPNPRCIPMIGLGVVLENIGAPSTQVVLNRYYNGRSTRKQLSCTLPAPAEDTNNLSLSHSKGKLTVTLNGKSCSVDSKLGILSPTIRPGIREVHISNLLE